MKVRWTEPAVDDLRELHAFIARDSEVYASRFVERDQLKQKTHITFILNGEQTEVAFAPHKTLLEVLREDLNLTGTKHGCELGECGTCAVLVDGRSILSCLMLGVEADDREVKSIEGMADVAE